MKSTSGSLKRLILGLSVEDAQSKFDTTANRKLLLHSHERHNLGILHELQLAQRKREALSPERKCYIVRFAKPTVRGFQAYIKDKPDDYVIREVWEDEEKQLQKQEEEENDKGSRNENTTSNVVNADNTATATTVTNNSNKSNSHSASTEEEHQEEHLSEENNNGKITENALLPSTSAIAVKLNAERKLFEKQRELMLETLAAALDNVADNVLSELTERRQSGIIVNGGSAQLSVVDKLVGEVSAAEEQGYKSLSSSTHLLDPVEMTLTLFSRKDKDIAEAFRTDLLTVPAKEGCISYSLWVAGGLIADGRLCNEFPFHIAKYVVPEEEEEEELQKEEEEGLYETSGTTEEHEGGKEQDRQEVNGTQQSEKDKKQKKHVNAKKEINTSNNDSNNMSNTAKSKAAPPHQRHAHHHYYLPRVDVEVYFSPELYRLQRLLGSSGLTQLRQFIGTMMMKQHEPTTTSASLLLNSHAQDRLMYYGYEGEASEGVVIPWVQQTEVKLSSVTGVVFSARQVESKDESAPIKKREAVLLVWKTWGHLIKDLHVHGDLDFLYVAIDRHKEVKESADYIEEVKKTLGGATNSNNYDGSTMLSSVAAINQNVHNTLALTTNHINTKTNMIRTGNALHSDKGRAKRRHMYIPLSTDFTVVECVLERKGLPHNMVMEDITSALTEMQSSQADMLRLSVLDRIMEERQEEKIDANMPHSNKREEIHEYEPLITPVLYTPKVVVSHAGVLENNTHSFQKIRIRGSSLAHVECLASALSDGSFFTNRGVYSSVLSGRGPGIENMHEKNKEGMSMINHLLDLHHLPANGSFTATHNAQFANASTERRLVGHRLGYRGNLDHVAQRGDANRFASTQRIESHEHMLIDATEREFWKENYYRLHGVQLIFHDRVDSQDAMVQQDTLSPRLQSYLRSLTSGLSAANEENDEERLQLSESNNNTNNKMTKLKARRRRTRKHVEPGKISMEKMYEYLCTDVEATTAEYDLHVGQCKSYFYELCLRRIPQHDAPYILPALHTLNNKGFINYVGPSRFGSYTQFNMHPGLHLLKNEFRAAAHVLVQQYYIDAALSAERKRTGCTFPSLLSLNNGLANSGGGGGGGYRLMDVMKGAGRKSVNENGTPIQRVLHNALQAAALIYGDEGFDNENTLLSSDISGNNNSTTKRLLLHNAQNYSDSNRQDMSKIHHKNKLVRSDKNSNNNLETSSSSNNNLSLLSSLLNAMLDDPCAEAFLNVIGPRACQILIQEFLAFVWNDIVNQRLQRYGTFAILPGDLVKERQPSKPRNTTWIDGVVQEHELHHVSRRDIERGLYTHWDVILPIPGANVILPDNHTADLYVVTLKRYGLNFNPELKQWGCFYPHGSNLIKNYYDGNDKDHEEKTNVEWNVKQLVSTNYGSNAIHTFSPYRSLTPSFQLMEEELNRSTPFTEVISHMYGSSSHDLIKASPAVMNAREQRRDLRLQSGNVLGLTIVPSYRHPLINPSSTLQWHFEAGRSEDPFQRWGTALRRVFPSLKQIPAIPLSTQQNAINVNKAFNSNKNSNTNRSNIIWSDETSELPQSTVHLLQESSKKIDNVSKESSVHNSNTNDNTNNSNSSTLSYSTMSNNSVISFLAPVPIQTHSSSSSSLMLDDSEGSSEIMTRNAPSKNESSERRRGARLPLPATPYWLPKHNNGCLRLRFTFPAGVYPRMMLRELTKSDVNVSDVVDVNRPVVDRRAKSFASLSREQQETFKRYLARNRQIKFDRPSHAVQLALLHQHIFRSGGVRHSLLPTMRSYDSLVKERKQ